LKSLHTFTNKSVQVVLAGFEQQIIPALAITCPGISGTCPVKRERHPLAVIVKKNPKLTTKLEDNTNKLNDSANDKV
jgi:hypothetical protein